MDDFDSIEAYLNQQKMGLKILMKTLLWLLLLVEVASFPPTLWKTLTGLYTAGTEFPHHTMLDTSGSGTMYTVYMDSTNTTAIFNTWTTSGPTLLLSQSHVFPNPLSEITMVPTLNHLSFSYGVAFDSSYHVDIIQKSNLALLANNPMGAKAHGVFLKNNNLFLFCETTEDLLQDPDGANTVLASFTTPTIFPSQIKYIYSSDETTIYTFYTDLSYFLMRVGTGPAELAANFNSPTQINLGSNYQCACYSNSLRLLFILESTGLLVVFNEVHNNITTLTSTSYLGMTDCYYDAQVNQLVFAQSYPGGTNLQNFELSTYTQNPGIAFGQQFKLDDSFSYFTLANAGDIQVYAIAASTCTTSQYFDTLTASCLSCPAGSATCINNLFCVGCPNGATRNTEGFCDPTEDSGTLLEKIVDNLVQNQYLQGVNRIPGGRKILPFLCFLVNIDELQLYMFHERSYGTRMDYFFTTLQNLEDEKWNMIGEQTTDKLFKKMGTSRDRILETLDTKANYTFPRFRSMEGRGDTFLPACWEFLTFNLLFVLVSFALLRWGFRLLRKYKVSLLLRPFSSFVFLSPMLLDGNLQYFCFLLFTQVQRGFSLNPRDRALTALNYIVYFFVIWFAVVSCFLSYYVNKRLTQYILDNWRTRVKGLLTYSLSNAFRMLVFGAIHSLLRSHPAQLPLLMGAQIVYITFMLFFMRSWRLHKVAYKVWFTIFFAGVRICMQITFYSIQHSGILTTELDTLFGQIIDFLMMLYLVGIYFATVWEIAYEIIQLFSPEEDNSQGKKKVKQKPPAQAKGQKDQIVEKKRQQKDQKVEKKRQQKDQKVEQKREQKDQKLLDQREQKEKVDEKSKTERKSQKKKKRSFSEKKETVQTKSKSRKKQRKKSLTSRMAMNNKKYNFIKIIKLGQNIQFSDDVEILQQYRGRDYLWIVGHRDFSKENQK